MKNDLLATLSTVSMTCLALESIRPGDTARALELLELELDASILRMNGLAESATGGEKQQLAALLERVRDYRRAFPRRLEADLSSMASGLLVRASKHAGQWAHQILEKPRT